jgi:hypothetical protein
MIDESKRQAQVEEKREAERTRGAKGMPTDEEDEEADESPKDRKGIPKTPDQAVQEEAKPVNDKDHFNRLIGPLKINLDTATVEEVQSGLAALITEKESHLDGHFSNGFEIHSKFRLLEEIQMMYRISDWRQLVIKKKEPLPPPEALDEDADGVGEDGEPVEDAE